MSTGWWPTKFFIHFEMEETCCTVCKVTFLCNKTRMWIKKYSFLITGYIFFKLKINLQYRAQWLIYNHGPRLEGENESDSKSHFMSEDYRNPLSFSRHKQLTIFPHRGAKTSVTSADTPIIHPVIFEFTPCSSSWNTEVECVKTIKKCRGTRIQTHLSCQHKKVRFVGIPEASFQWANIIYHSFCQGFAALLLLLSEEEINPENNHKHPANFWSSEFVSFIAGQVHNRPSLVLLTTSWWAVQWYKRSLYLITAQNNKKKISEVVKPSL